MKAIILSAGLGTRLRPLTEKIPKPMIDIAGKPVLARIADHLNKFGIYDIVVNVHYLPDVIMKHFGTRFLYSYEPELLGEEGTIESLKRWTGNDYCLVCNGDTLTNLSIAKMMAISEGRNIKYYDKDVYAGYRVVEPEYRVGDPSATFESGESFWIDMGTPEGLEKAREKYEEIDKMSELRN